MLNNKYYCQQTKQSPLYSPKEPFSDANIILDKTHMTYEVSAPSNIAFIKYWGKEDETQQWPANDSLSMTLSQSVTITTVKIAREEKKDSFQFNNKSEKNSLKFGQKAINHISRLRKMLGFSEYLVIKSRNTFPSSCGIASSASSMASLTLAALACWTQSKSIDDLSNYGFTIQNISRLARLGSGSSCRSLLGGFVEWKKGTFPEDQQLNLLYDKNYWDLSDLIVIFSEEPKYISSTKAHRLAWTSPRYVARLEILPQEILKMKEALANKDLSTLGPLIEKEALNLHEIIMSTHPPVYFLTERTLQFIEWIKCSRKEYCLQAYFTIDAGSTVHIICESKNCEMVHQHLLTFDGQLKIIRDKIGSGPSLIVQENH